MNSRLPLLYTFRRCPYAMRARMAIRIAGIRVQQVEVALKNKPQELLNYSPKGTVPVLVTETGEVVDQSRDIMLWALQISDPCNWLFNDNALAQQQMKQLVDKCDTEFKPLLDRYKYFDRYPERSQEDYRHDAEIFDNHMRFADVAIFPFIRQFAAVDANWFSQSPYKKLQAWLDVCINTQLFKDIMAKQEV